MAAEWTRQKLGNLCHVNPEKRDRGWPYDSMRYIDISSVGTGIFNEPPHRINVVAAPSRAQRLVRPGDSIVSTVRPNRRSFMYLREPDEDWVVSTGFAVLRRREGRLDSRFLYYLVTIQSFTDYLVNHAIGSAYPSVNADVFEQADVCVPDLRTQEQIGDILGSLDDKIELNQQMNGALETMALAIFKAWFIDFDPVKAKSAGATSFRGMPQDVFDQLPHQLTDSKLGPIPTGWDVVPMSALVELLGGGTPKRKVAEYWGGNIPWFSVRDAPAEHDVWIINTKEHITETGIENSSAKVMREGTTIISARGTVGRLALTSVPMAMNQSCYGVQGSQGVGDFFVYFTLYHAIVELQQHTHGSVFDTITRKTFDTLDRVRSQPELMEAFEKAVAPYLQLMRNNLLESRAIANIRDTLLPKLISGKIRVHGGKGVNYGR